MHNAIRNECPKFSSFQSLESKAIFIYTQWCSIVGGRPEEKVPKYSKIKLDNIWMKSLAPSQMAGYLGDLKIGEFVKVKTFRRHFLLASSVSGRLQSHCGSDESREAARWSGNEQCSTMIALGHLHVSSSPTRRREQNKEDQIERIKQRAPNINGTI